MEFLQSFNYTFLLLFAVGRPRIHPQPNSPKKVKPKIAQPSADALNIAIESILPKNQTTIKEIKASEITTSYTILTNVVPTTSAKLDIRTVPSSSIQTAIPSTGGNKIITIPLNIQRQMKNVKVVPPSQFIQIKQSAAANASKVFTLKPNPSVKPQSNTPLQYTVRTQPTAEIRQFKTTSLTPLKMSSGTGPQIISSVQIKPPQTKQAISLNPAKFTIVNSGPSTSNTQINKIITTASTSTANKLEPNISTADIFDIPILFADNDGNIQESEASPEVTVASPSTSSIVISPTQTNRIIVNTGNPIKTSTVSTPTMNKMVILNRSGQVKTVTTSPSGGIRSMPPLKYTRVLVSTPSSSPISTVNKSDLTIASPGPSSNVITTATTTQPVFKQTSFLPGSKVEIVNNQIIKSSPNSANVSGSVQQAKYKPIVINVDSDKTTVKNIIRVGDTQIKTPNTIVLKPSKTFPILNSGILNHRNLTVRKVVNLIPQKQAAAATGGPEMEMIVVPKSTEE